MKKKKNGKEKWHEDMKINMKNEDEEMLIRRMKMKR
jgi:hypothetical protein